MNLILYLILSLMNPQIAQAKAAWLLFQGVASSFTNGHSTTFNGSTQYVDFGNHLDFAYNHAMSVFCWTKLGGLTQSFKTIIGKAQAVNYAGWELQALNQKLSFSRGGGSGSAYWELDETSNGLTSTATWFFVGATADTSGHSSGGKLFVASASNVAVTSANDALGTGSTTSSQNLRIGDRETNFYNGKVNNCSVWDADESANAAAIYNGGSPGSLAGIDDAHLKFWTYLGDGDANGTNTWIDHSASGFTGTDTASPTITTDHP